jgi:hypothetical protein
MEGLGRSGRAEVAARPVAAAQPPGGRQHALGGDDGGTKKEAAAGLKEDSRVSTLCGLSGLLLG